MTNQFNYFSDTDGEAGIRKIILNYIEGAHAVEFPGTSVEKISLPEELINSSRRVMVSRESEINSIVRTDKDFVSLYQSPIVEYCSSFKRPDSAYVSGRLAYFGPKHFKIAREFRKIVTAIQHKCWKSEKLSYWVLNIGEGSNFFIPNQIVSLRRK